MIEIPEVLTIAGQMNNELKGKTIESAIHGDSPHKFAFYNLSQEEYEEILQGKTVREVKGDGHWIFTSLEPEHVLLLGAMGGKILFHRDEKTLPEKHQLLLHFEDDTYLTVSIQGWGFIQIVKKSEIDDHPHAGKRGISPLNDEFTFGHFKELFEEADGRGTKSIKKFMISEPGISGVGNGYLQDILFWARIHPKRRVVDIADDEKQALYDAIRETLKEAVNLGGRDTERDFYNNPGGYKRVLDSRTKDKPCPVCGTPIEKIQYLGGASYFCPSCQI